MSTTSNHTEASAPITHAIREKAITRTSIIGIVCNVLLASLKAVIGLIAGSVAVVLDAVNNLTDAMSSIITIIGIKLAHRKPDEKHPFGYGRVEYLSTIVIAGLVLSAGFISLKESFDKILAPELPEISAVTFASLCVALLVKAFMGRFFQAQGKKYNSDALVASGKDATMDVFVSLSTILCMIVAKFAHLSIDGFVGLLISGLIIKTGIETLIDTLSTVIGSRPDSELTKDIKKTVAGIAPVLGAYDLVLHNYGPDKAIGSIHVEIPADLSADAVHHLTKEIQLTVMEQYHIFITVGIYAVDARHDELRKQIRALATAHPGVLNTHAVYVDEEKKYVSFDVLTDFSVPSRPELRKALAAEVNDKLLPGYTVDLSFDTNYSS